MHLKNTSGVTIAKDLTAEDVKETPGIEIVTTEAGEEAVVKDRVLFEAFLNEHIKTLNERLSAEGLTEKDKKELQALKDEDVKLRHDLNLLPVYDESNNIIDAIEAGEEGHKDYEAVLADGTVIHFKKVKVKAPDAVTVYPVYDYQENKVRTVTEEDGMKDESLTPVYDENDKLASFLKETVFVFNVAAGLGHIRIEGAETKEEAFEKLKQVTLENYINRDNTSLAFIE